KLASARSTFVHDVFWVSIAPMITSNGVSAGHQCCAPQLVLSLRYILRIMASGLIGSFRLMAAMVTLAILAGDGQYHPICLEFRARPSFRSLAKSISALAHRNVYRNQDAKHRLFGILRLCVARASGARTISEVDGRDGALCAR